MKPFSITVLLSLLCTLGCHRSPAVQPPHKSRTIRDGSSYSSAVLIGAQTQEEGLREEYAYLQRHFPGSRQAEVENVGGDEVVFGHRTTSYNGKIFSVQTLVLSDGMIREVYFDITSYIPKK